MTRILIADDEPLLRAQLREVLQQLWPEAEVVAEAEDGFGALRLAEARTPDLVFLDIRMPGLSGLEVANALGASCHIVFVTAYGDHAIEAFEQGAIDYVLKPAEPARLARTVARLKQRVLTPPSQAPARALAQLESAPALPAAWIQASVGATTHFITLPEVIYFQSDAKYTKVVTDRLEAHIRRSIKELSEALDAAQFWQIHRGTLVAVERIAAVRRDGDGGMVLLLREHPAQLPVSQSFQHRFKQM